MRVMLQRTREPEHSVISQRCRGRRWQLLASRFPDLAEMAVVDLGGTARSWALAPVHPARLVLINAPSANAMDKVHVVQGDACDPALLHGERFDLVYSNSVIEHVGGHWRRQRFAETVDRLGAHHWIQTPYRFFPVEPHYFCPGAQFLPAAARSHFVRWWPVGNFGGYRAVDRKTEGWALGIELLSKTSMRHYFPNSEIVPERIAGLVKSLIAVR